MVGLYFSSRRPPVPEPPPLPCLSPSGEIYYLSDDRPEKPEQVDDIEILNPNLA